ncbi:MAG TPA: cupin domain-containing protein [Longimicrobiales bacterium]|nr:cupin domain-containing protein [Longimicrobiales bacterium]
MSGAVRGAEAGGGKGAPAGEGAPRGERTVGAEVASAEGRSGRHAPTRVEKPWGHELIWARSGRYVGKVLHVKAGHALSLQYHEHKDETIHLLTGRMRFWAGPSRDHLEEVLLQAGDSYRIVPGTIHRMEAVTDVDILEASTPELDDVVRLEDRYGRS